MTSWHSLLACPQADVTIERLAALAASTGTEPLTVDFKEKADRRVADCVASMANAAGGLVLVGITDADRKIVGVKVETLAHVADMLATRLDPADWLPEMFEREIGGSAPDRYVLVIRIRPELAPRPVMVQRTGPGGDGIFWCPVRIPGGTRQATRAELAALFAEPAPGRSAPASAWEVEAPQLPTRSDGLPEASVDMMLKTGLSVTPGPACPGRPLSENVIANLATALDKSPLAQTLIRLSGIVAGGLYNTARRGPPNTSGTATLTWQIASSDLPTFEVRTMIVAPGQYGHPHIQKLTISLDVTSRFSAWAHSPRSPQPPPPGPARRLETTEWAALLDSMTATLTSPEFVAAIADLADVDPIVVPPPQVVHVISNGEIARLLPPLSEIPGATGSRGAHLRADPALSLADPEDRARQVIRWLCQIAADAGLIGMERLTQTALAPGSPPSGAQPSQERS
jgi:hypothetical protein